MDSPSTYPTLHCKGTKGTLDLENLARDGRLVDHVSKKTHRRSSLLTTLTTVAVPLAARSNREHSLLHVRRP